MGRNFIVCGRRRLGRYHGACSRHCHVGCGQFPRLPALRESMDAGVNASALPVLSVASLVGFGSVIAALPAFAMVRDWVLSIEGLSTAGLAGGRHQCARLFDRLGIGRANDRALDALGSTYMRLAAEHGIDPGLLHRVAVIGAGTLDSLPHNGAVVTLLAVCDRRIAKVILISSWCRLLVDFWGSLP